MAQTSYTQADLAKAIQCVKSGATTRRGACQVFGIPYTTLADNLKKNNSKAKKERTVLTKDEETRICEWIITMAKRGFRRTRNDIKDVVKKFLDSQSRKTRFENNRPGKDWFQAFLKRHPEISERMPQALGRERAMVSADSLQTWFSEYENNIRSVDPALLTSPDRIYNADETGFSVCPSNKTVLAPVGLKHLYRVTSSTRTQVTTLACTSATGEYVRPLLIFPFNRDPPYNPLSGFDNAYYQRTENGWITPEVFSKWLRDVFIPSVETKVKPVVLFVDGHTSHCSTLEVSDICQENGVLLYCLRPHSSHLLQPLDLTFFGTLKRAWCEEVRKHTDRTGEAVTLASFAKVFHSAYIKSLKPELAFSAFAKSGIFPFNPAQVLESEKIVPSENFSHSPPHPSDSPVGIPNETSLSTSLTDEKLDILEELFQFDSEENIRNLKRLREGYDVDDEAFQNFKRIVSKLLDKDFNSRSKIPGPEPHNISPLLDGATSPHEDHSQSPLRGETAGALLTLPSFSRKRKPKEGCMPMSMYSEEYANRLTEKIRKTVEIEVEEQKKQRKILREERRKEKEEAKKSLDKKREKKKKLKKDLEKNRKKSHKKKVNTVSNDLQVEIDDIVLENFMVDDDDEGGQCMGCKGDIDFVDWVQCCKCEGWWHICCVAQTSVRGKCKEELEDLDFYCEHCASF